MAIAAFQSTLSVRRATHLGDMHGRRGRISIHALREESDFKGAALRTLTDEFQSTLSVRRATRARRESALFLVISIHALREESDRTLRD